MARRSRQKRLGFIGAGKMATALAKGIIEAGLFTRRNVLAGDPVATARASFVAGSTARVTQDNAAVVKASDVVVLAVKPQAMDQVLAQIAASVEPRHLLVSIAAGVPVARLEARLPAKTHVIRVMPNTPCLVGAGAAAYCRGRHATRTDAEFVRRLLEAVGTACEVEEKLIDAVTGLSGSGPAYVFQFIEALSDGGLRVGLPRPLATQLAAQTVLGAAKLVLETGSHPGELKDMVTSPGGTTIAGLHALEQGGLRAAVMDAVEAATERSIELAR